LITQGTRGGKYHRKQTVSQLSKEGRKGGLTLNREVEDEPRFLPGKPGLEKTLLLLLLALDTMASPGDGFQPLHLNFFVTG